MQNLQLGDNKLIGEIPKEISNLVELEVLDLSGNSFSGSLDMEIFNISGLRFLNLERNNLTSDSTLRFLTSLASCRNLTFLSVYLNPLIGMLPASIGNLSTSLRTFVANICKIKGRIPNEVGNLSILLDLSLSGNNLHLGDIYLDQNLLSGSLPNCLGNITSLREIHLGSNKLSSNITPSLGKLQDLVVLDLSSNNMKLEACKIWKTFLLRHKKLQGAIPDSMSNMVGLEFLDLSHNNISGIIPKCLEKLQNLKYFNVSVNKLYGEIPSGGPFKNLSMVFVTMAFVLLWIRYRRGKSIPQQAESLSTVTRERISYYEPLQATDDLSECNLIVFGSFGSVYKDILRSGTAIAVKVFNLQLDAAFKSFDKDFCAAFVIGISLKSLLVVPILISRL
ncbi:LRR receptor-like serine/threonine-protein kinase ERECTA [Capsicum annuum]|uniref:LRR receptor-like serine/threonine-protein kinase ERECTA n=1 Tax=Capsicum annuum TaxID=4072 RepID=UPI001FB0BDF4|nr:LRR receptor-like serine/threonine-protein kinase ERECTA [Capsicum annuum]